MPRDEEQTGEGDSEARHRILLDVAEKRVGERQRADENREHGFQQAVAVEEAHVAGRERARRHLDDEDADRDDETG